MTVTATITARINATVASPIISAQGSGPTIDLIGTTLITPGTGANQADLMFADTRTLAASASENLDLNGALTDVLGKTLNLLKVKAIMVRASGANANDIVIGGAATNGFVGPFGAAAHTIAVRPGGEFVIAHSGAGWPVVAGTGDLLKIANGGAGTSVTYDIIIIGTTV
jgi:hypothetical protein